jgi:hypothetical protein
MRLELASRLTGVDVWDAVEVELQVPILLITTRTTGNASDGLANRTFFGKPHHLVDFEISSDIQILTVDLFSPPHLNATGAWRLDRVSEVWECCERSDRTVAWLFILADGAQISDSLQCSKPRDLLRTRRVYSELSHSERAIANHSEA